MQRLTTALFALVMRHEATPSPLTMVPPPPVVDAIPDEEKEAVRLAHREREARIRELEELAGLRVPKGHL